MPDILTGLGLVTAVLIVAALASGFVECAPLSYSTIFMGMGALFSRQGLGVLELDAHAPMSLVLNRANISNVARGFVAWFGPRGLNSLLLALLVVKMNLG